MAQDFMGFDSSCREHYRKGICRARTPGSITLVAMGNNAASRADEDELCTLRAPVFSKGGVERWHHPRLDLGERRGRAFWRSIAAAFSST